ncbi:MAG: 4-demethylwyosine synthase TYW1 [Candidatus Heimdallarchaeota archaeon]|nr:4-demethylwyosine synthase TYW1 [Candidatus Heimdallarchaeota archaeon]
MSFSDQKMQNLLKKQKYQLYGKNTSVKKCRWTHNALRENRYCYKRFYGIRSHQCIQFSPTLICNFSCQFCWRIHERDIDLPDMYDSYRNRDKDKLELMFDRPKEVIKGILLGQKRIICGYKPFVDLEKYNEAMNPKHATLSLTGEPFLYPWIPELINELKALGMTVFIVTNGSVPETLLEILEKTSFPTQLYVTLPAPGEKLFLRTHRPAEKLSAMRKIWSTLEIIGAGVPFRTVGRLTVAEGLNLVDPEGYAKMISVMKPSFIEVKGVVHVGAAEKRLPRSVMPSHKKIVSFSLELEKLTGYKLVKQSQVSRLVILTNNSYPLLIPELQSNADLLPNEDD